jgi:phosphate transport system substrate-binding protein
VGVIPGIREYLAEFTGEAAMGDYGYLADKGLIPLADNDRKASVAVGRDLTTMHFDGAH